MTPFSDVLEQASSLVARVAGSSLGSLRDQELLVHVAEVESLGRLVDALRMAAAGEIDERSGAEHGPESLSRRHQCANSALLIEQLTRTSQSEAMRRVRIGRATAEHLSLTGEILPAPFEHVAAALASGELGMDAAAVIIRHLTDASRSASPSAVRDAEAHLVDQATTLSATLVAVQAQQLCAALDPDGVRPREELLRQQRRFRLGREVDGLTPFSGLADPVNAGLLRAALSERTAPSRTPRFLDSSDCPHFGASDDADAEREAAPAPLDRRTREQRAFDIVFGLLTSGIRTDSDTVGSLHGTATVNVVVTARELLAGTGAAWIDDTLTPVSTTTAREIICDGGVQLQIHSDKGQILWEGRRERYFTPAQRRALAVRDGGCVGPGCTAPPSWCHAHHVIEWEHGGRTDVDNGALLCAFHHHQLHSGGFQLRMTHGIPELLAPPWFDREQRWRPASKSRLARAA